MIKPAFKTKELLLEIVKQLRQLISFNETQHRNYQKFGRFHTDIKVAVNKQLKNLI